MFLEEEWHRFLSNLRCFGCDGVFRAGLQEFDPSHPYEDYRESSLAEYFELLGLANGQSAVDKPVFRSVSGWNKSARHCFLSLDESLAYYRRIISDQELVQVLGLGFVPISADSVAPSQPLDELFAIDLATGEVCLLWCFYADPFNPPEWQISCFRVSKSLSAFLCWQNSFYGESWQGERMTTPFKQQVCPREERTMPPSPTKATEFRPPLVLVLALGVVYLLSFHYGLILLPVIVTIAVIALPTLIQWRNWLLRVMSDRWQRLFSHAKTTNAMLLPTAMLADKPAGLDGEDKQLVPPDETISDYFYLIIQQWEESEREEGWGCTVRPDGFSIHRSPEALLAFIQGYWDAMPDKKNGKAPDLYSRPVGEPLVVKLAASHTLVQSLMKQESQRLHSWEKETYAEYRVTEQLWKIHAPQQGWHVERPNDGA